MDNAAIRAAAEQQRAQVISFGREPAPLKQYVRLLEQKRATEQKQAAKAAEGEAAGAALPDAREAALRTKCALDARRKRERRQNDAQAVASAAAAIAAAAASLHVIAVEQQQLLEIDVEAAEMAAWHEAAQRDEAAQRQERRCEA